MKELDDKTNESQKENIQRVSQESSSGGTAQLVDNRSSVAVQRKLQDSMSASSANGSNPIQRKANSTGLPDNLKSGIENLSGYSMDDVKVHYNSSKPAQLQAHAYAQGTDIHLASGQEKHLPHEAWHVVQQKQGRVKPTKQLKSRVNVNDDVGLEKEADVMGDKAFQMKRQERRGDFSSKRKSDSDLSEKAIVQGKFKEDLGEISFEKFKKMAETDERIGKVLWKEFNSLKQSKTVYDIGEAIEFILRSREKAKSNADGANTEIADRVNRTVSFARDGAIEIIRKIVSGELSMENQKFYDPIPDLIVSVFMFESSIGDLEKEYTLTELIEALKKFSGRIDFDILPKAKNPNKTQRYNDSPVNEDTVFNLPNHGDSFTPRVSTLYRNPGLYDAPDPALDGFILWTRRLGLEKTKAMLWCMDSYGSLDAASRSWITRAINVNPYFGTSHENGGAGQGGKKGTYKIDFTPALYVHSNKDKETTIGKGANMRKRTISNNGKQSIKIISDTGNLDTAKIIAFGTGFKSDEVTFTTPLLPGDNGNTTVSITKV